MEKNYINIAKKLSGEFLEFVNKAVSPFHVVQESKSLLLQHGYKEISEQDNWELSKEGKYFFSRNRSTIVAFQIGKYFDPNNTGFKIIGAHTDSPVLRLAPLSKLQQEEYIQTHVTTYGGGLWHTWFDRDLTLAGRVITKTQGAYSSSLFHYNKPLLKIPSLAIHLTPGDERGKFSPNNETHLRPVFSHSVYTQLTGTQPTENQEAPLKNEHYSGLLELISKEINTPVQNIIDLDLYFLDSNPGSFFGPNEEFISSARLDNLFSSFMALKGLTDPESVYEPSTHVNMVCLFDHEECGSQSFQGAGSTLTKQTIERIFAVLSYGQEVKPDSLQKLFHNSFCISADMAHSVHPNYAEKHKSGYKVNLNQGVVVKTNYNQNYATDGASKTIVKIIADRSKVKLQEFIVKNDSTCGSTIGPMTSANCGIKCVDIGAPQLSMHSIRETCGVLDSYHYEKLFAGFFREYETIQHDLLRF